MAEQMITIKKRKRQSKYLVYGNGTRKTVKLSSNINSQTKKVSTCLSESVEIITPQCTPDATLEQMPQDIPLQENSMFKKTKLKRLENWEKVFNKILEAGIARNSLSNRTCSFCLKSENTLFRCIDCIGYPVMCHVCLNEKHNVPHLHIFEKWNTCGVFVEYDCNTPVWKNGRHTKCGTTYEKEILIMDDKGRQHKRMVQFCLCEEEVVSLIHFGLWASSPVKPRLAFHLELLYWLNGLLLECKVSVKGFCEALKARQPKMQKLLVTKEGREIYKALIDETIHIFRRYVYQLDYPTDIFPETDDGSSCPACYNAKKRFFCIDADFQLIRKSSSGMEWVEPRHKDRFFISQRLVDDFIQNYSNPALEKECSDFQAGSYIRSKGKNAKLSETAVFGSTCRHDFPQKFFNLKHGERLGYAVFLIEQIVSENAFKEIHISYDIACLLVKHLKKLNREDLLNKVTYSVPIFHSYGHNLECQLLYSPSRTKNVGLLDGKGIERLWSYLGGFATISKEMTPENRVDLLTDGLLFYGQKLRDKQGYALVHKFEKASNLQETTKLALDDILKSFPETSHQEQVIERWREEEKNCIFKSNEMDQQPQLSYCMLGNIHKLASERQYLLYLLKKYAKGQTIYIRLAKQINNVNNKLKKGLEKFNLNRTEGILTFEDVKNPENQIFNGLNLSTLNLDSVPISIKQEAVYLSCLLERCTEEKELLKHDMESVIQWYINQYQKNIGELEMCALSEKHFFLKEALYLEIAIKRLSYLFEKYLGVNSQDTIEFIPLLCEQRNDIEEIFHQVKDQEVISVPYDDSDDDCDLEDCDLT